MPSKPVTRRTFVTGMLFVGAGTACRLGRAEIAGGANLPVVDAKSLGGEARYLTFVGTDKPMYRGGEKLYVRAVVLHHVTHAPLPSEPKIMSLIEITGPKGDQVASGYVAVEEGVLGFSWPIPDDRPGGEYTVKVTFPQYGHTPAERKFDIRAYRAPRLKTQIKFLRDGYGPGDEAAATLHVERTEGGVPTGATVTALARIDDQESYRGPVTIDREGNGTARFRLPAKIARGEGSLAFVIDDGGAVETAVKTIPILLQTVDLTIYPEGGDLVAGLPNRVYFEAFTPAKKPADLAGVVVDDRNREVAKFRSEHEGRGRCEFTPQADRRYYLRIEEPAGIAKRFILPEVRSTGAVIRATHDVYPKREQVDVEVGSTSGEAIVTLSKREMVLGRKTVGGANHRLQAVSFEVPAETDGVLTATVWNADGKPLAERLLFRQPAQSVQVTITPDSATYSPGGKAKVLVKTTDETGSPVGAVVGLAVTDDGVLEMIEKREQSPRLPVMVYLENEVRELADAHVYLDAKNERAPLAIDLLLGTQGWRRFALVVWQKFLTQHGDQAQRALAKLAPPPPPTTTSSFGGAMLGAAPAGFAIAPQAAPAPDAAAGAPPAPRAALPDEFAKNKDAPRPEAKLNAALEADARRQGGKEAEQRANAAEPQANAAAAKPLAKQLALDDARTATRRNDFVYTRVYAHASRPNRTPGERVDFTETLFWHAGLKTNDQGEATIEFALNDSVTTFRVFADAFNARGAIGSATTLLESLNPFYLEPKLPLEVTQGDRILLPVTCVNTTASPLGAVSMKIDAKFAVNSPSPASSVELAANGRERTLVELEAGSLNGSYEATITAAAGPYADRVTRSIAVRPRGFPIEVSRGGMLEKNTAARHEIVIPADLVEGSFESKIEVYPTPLACLTQALESLIREPCGCFEQTSSTVYPLVMAQQYFMSHQGVPASLVERSAQILSRGYERLLGFESKSGGFEWFGGDPGHDALTAYGLMEFTDMAQVHPVDKAMLKRTREWLLAQRDGKGSFARKTHTLHTWLAEPEIATSYNVWALLSAGVEADLSKEVNWIRRAAESTVNTYVSALAANVMFLAGHRDGTASLLDKLSGKQDDNGSLKGATVSVVGSGGEALVIETTALAVLAWLQDPRYSLHVEKGIQFLAEQCKGGRFGSTQSTLLALKAIIAYDQSRAKPKAPGRLQLVVDGKAVGEPVAFNEQTHGAITLPALPVPGAGKHSVEVRMDGGAAMPHSVWTRFSRLQPDSSAECKLHLEASLSESKLTEGATTEVRVTVINRTGDVLPTPIAVIGLPGGLEVRHDQLKELVKAGTVAAYEVIGREVVLYWRSLPTEARVSLPLSVVAAVPGRYTGPASRIYQYYTDEHKHWVAGLQVEIEPLRG